MLQVTLIYGRNVFAGKDSNLELLCRWVPRGELCTCGNEVGDGLVYDLIGANLFRNFGRSSMESNKLRSGGKINAVNMWMSDIDG